MEPCTLVLCLCLEIHPCAACISSSFKFLLMNGTHHMDKLGTVYLYSHCWILTVMNIIVIDILVYDFAGLGAT